MVSLDCLTLDVRNHHPNHADLEANRWDQKPRFEIPLYRASTNEIGLTCDEL